MFFCMWHVTKLESTLLIWMRPEIRDQRSEIRDQRSEIRDQRSEIRDHIEEVTQIAEQVYCAKDGPRISIYFKYSAVLKKENS